MKLICVKRLKEMALSEESEIASEAEFFLGNKIIANEITKN